MCSYKVIRELKLPTFQRVIKQNKFELIRIAKRRPDRVNMSFLFKIDTIKIWGLIKLNTILNLAYFN